MAFTSEIWEVTLSLDLRGGYLNGSQVAFWWYLRGSLRRGRDCDLQNSFYMLNYNPPNRLLNHRMPNGGPDPHFVLIHDIPGILDRLLNVFLAAGGK